MQGPQIRIQEPPVVTQEPPIDAWGLDEPPAEQPSPDRLGAARGELKQAEEAIERCTSELASTRRQVCNLRAEIEQLQRPVRPDRRFWPAGEELPQSYTKQVIPCPECRRVLTDEGGRAAICTSSAKDIAFFRCRCCGHRWQMPVKGA
jgi:hypothetical protein